MELKPTSDASPAQWILEGIAAKERNVRSEIPDVFEAYCRLLHPARRYELAADGRPLLPGGPKGRVPARAEGRLRRHFGGPLRRSIPS